MKNRRGEKLGWIFGLLGGTVWMFVLAAYGLFGGNWRFGAIALGGGLLVVGLLIQLAPWKNPTTRYWKLFLPPIEVMILTAGVLITCWGHGLSTLNWIPIFLCIFLPFAVSDIRSRRWEDGNGGKNVIPAEKV